ncbi:MAG TPA: VWA domain-containing protein, partial [Pyrinomonadaceae bacterium]|nr:VWA domain-containing protein [Pyrinomonadaceae bacterium]
MRYLVSLFLLISLVPAVVFSQSGVTKICRELAIPDGYVIVGYEPSSACSNGAYVLRREDAQPQRPASRTRRTGDKYLDAVIANSALEEDASTSSEPKLHSTFRGTPLDEPLKSSIGDNSSGAEEVSEGDVVRIDTNLVTVPVSVLDRQGRFISDLRSEKFRVFENGVEQQIVHFEPTDKPFTVALMLDTSASTFFHLWEIKAAAIAFAKQLRPQDRVLVVTFDRLVMLLTEATNDQKVITEVIERDAHTGFSTRLYDSIDLVMKRRLNKIPGRKAIVLFTDGVDT